MRILPPTSMPANRSLVISVHPYPEEHLTLSVGS
jgi:hypothetical protein